jgi:MFS family permease
MLAFPTLAMWIQRDLGLSFGETVALGFWMYLLYGLTALPFGWLATRIDSRRLLAGSIFATGAFAIAAGFANSAILLTLTLAGVGIGAAVYHPVGMALISRCCEHRGMALGRNGVWGSTSLAGAPLFAGTAAELIGWRGALWLSGGVAIALGAWLWHRNFDEATVASRSSSTPHAGTLTAFGIMLGCMTMLGFCYRSTTVVLPAWFRLRVEDLGQLFATGGTDDIAFAAAMLVGISYCCGIAGQLTGGKLADRFDLRFAYLGVHFAALPCLALLSALHGLPVVIAAAAYLFFSLGMQPIENALVATLTPERYRSLAYGAKFILVMGGGSLAVELVRHLESRQSIDRLFPILMGLLAIVIFGAVAIILVTRNRKAPEVNSPTTESVAP